MLLEELLELRIEYQNSGGYHWEVNLQDGGVEQHNLGTSRDGQKLPQF